MYPVYEVGKIRSDDMRTSESERKNLPERLAIRLNARMICERIQHIMWKVVDWIYLAQDRNHQRDLFNTIRNM
jgi:hypothetical protein